jgi:hypothetical protein
MSRRHPERIAIEPWSSPRHQLRGQRLLDIAALATFQPFEHLGTVGEWTCASDGRVLLAVRTTSQLAAGLNAPAAELLGEPAKFELTHLASKDLLREPVLEQQRVERWATVLASSLTSIGRAPKSCTECAGSGSCREDGCGCLGAGACALCAGTGALPARKYVLAAAEEAWIGVLRSAGGLVDRTLVNRELVWLALPPDVPGDQVVHVGLQRPVGDDYGTLVLIGEDWRAMACGMRPGRDADAQAEFFLLGEAEHPREVRA